MSRVVTIPHQHVRIDAERDGTVRGVLVAGLDGNAHGHLSVATRDAAHRYRAVSGSAGQDPIISVQLEEIRTDPGTIALASVDVRISVAGQTGPVETADIILTRLPDGTEILRATVQLEVEDEEQAAPVAKT